MELSNLISEIRKSFPVLGAVRVNKEDGEVKERGGDVSQKLIDIGAFLGSAGEIISKKLLLQNPEYGVMNSDGLNVVIVNDKQFFTVISVSDEAEHKKIFEIYRTAESGSAEEKVVEQADEQADELSDLAGFASSTEQENRIGEIERKLLGAKILQINYLVEEFAQGGPVTEWNVFLSDRVLEIEDFKKAVEVSDKLDLLEIIPVEISRDSIQVNTKSLIDAVCKKAVEKYGAVEAKKMVQNVITKLNKK